MLDEVGLPDELEQTYRALVRLSTARAGDLAGQLEVGEADARKRLEELTTFGLAVAAQPGADPLFQPLAPDAALGAALVSRQQALETARTAVAQLTEEYRASVRRHDADQLVEIVHGRAAMRQRLRHLQQNVRTEALFFCRANPVAMSSQENGEEFDALARGVRYRVIYERALLEEPGMVDNLAAGIRCGEQARSLPALPVRLGILDRSVALCPLVPDHREGGEPTAAVVGRSQLLDALLALFDSYWDRASPVQLANPTPGAGPVVDQPDAQERLLLSLFVAGLPDKAVASQLGVSRRTVQRRLGDLMARAGVDTRPGLAFQASRRGWV